MFFLMYCWKLGSPSRDTRCSLRGASFLLYVTCLPLIVINSDGYIYVMNFDSVYGTFPCFFVLKNIGLLYWSAWWLNRSGTCVPVGMSPPTDLGSWPCGHKMVIRWRHENPPCPYNVGPGLEICCCCVIWSICLVLQCFKLLPNE